MSTNHLEDAFTGLMNALNAIDGVQDELKSLARILSGVTESLAKHEADQQADATRNTKADYSLHINTDTIGDVVTAAARVADGMRKLVDAGKVRAR